VSETIFSFSATETGYNHTKAEPSKICEDASGCYDDERMHICAVADGHGSDNYPRTERGAKYAVDAAIGQIKKFVADADKERIFQDTDWLKQLSQSILEAWMEMVAADVAAHPFEETEMEHVSDKYKKKYLSEDESERSIEKAYGCTLIAYTVTEDFSFGIQIGDGKCVVIDADGTFTEPIPWDENCQMNVTTSLCDSDAKEEFRFTLSKDRPAAVFCGTDGVDDSYVGMEEVYALYRSIIKIFTEHGSQIGKAEIKEYLPVLTRRGSGDDVSIALIMDRKKLDVLASVFEAQTKLFNMENQ
jgi:hypothetical protein